MLYIYIIACYIYYMFVFFSFHQTPVCVNLCALANKRMELYSTHGALYLQLTQLSGENVYFKLLSSSNQLYESFTIV